MASLLTAEKEESNEKNNYQLSKNELFNISTAHVDPRNPSNQQISVIAEENSLSSKEPSTEPVIKLRMGSKAAIDGYTKLTNKFGFFGNKDQISLSVRNKERYDVILDTTNEKPAIIAIELLKKLNLTVSESEDLKNIYKK